MVCSACGYENQVGNRFCGMCGIPLPHRPLTTPGAQSTASLTHALGESRARTEGRTSDPSAVSSSPDVASPPNPRDHDGQSVTSADLDDLSGEPLRSSDQPAKVSPPQFDLVPEIPLDEYVQKFHYVPPSDPGEFTMRGDTAAIEPAPPAAPENSSGYSGHASGDGKYVSRDGVSFRNSASPAPGRRARATGIGSHDGRANRPAAISGF